MNFRILGHACLEVSSAGTNLLCDPWLVGSAYWRSWWNYPPVPDGLVETLKPDYIYLTHLHWDHFHGPTLRRLGLEHHILVPKTPDRRIVDDLRAMGCSNITEIVHGKALQLGQRLRITSYQFGHFPDSGAVNRGGRYNNFERQRLQDHGLAVATNNSKTSKN